MAIRENSVTAFARIKFGDLEESDDLQTFGASLIEIARINNAIRLADPESKSYNPELLESPYFYRNRLNQYLKPSDRLYLVRANKQSPTWIEIGTFAATVSTLAVYSLQAIIMLLTRRDQNHWRREDRQRMVHEYLRSRLPNISEVDARRVSTLIYHSLDGLEKSDNPLVAIDNLLDSPQQQEGVNRAFRALVAGRDSGR